MATRPVSLAAKRAGVRDAAAAARTDRARRIRAIFSAPQPRPSAQRLRNEAVAQWRIEAPKLAHWAEANLPDGFAVFDYPPAHRVRLRTTDGLQRINREVKRRTRVASMFPDAASCLRLVSALLTEFDEEWMTGNFYLTMKP